MFDTHTQPAPIQYNDQNYSNISIHENRQSGIKIAHTRSVVASKQYHQIEHQNKNKNHTEDLSGR